MRILVTGVTGQVGGAVLDRLQGFGTVLPADRSELDLARPDEILARLERLAPNLIINPAAYTAVDQAEAERGLALTVNAVAPGIMARWAAARSVPFLQLSTDYVFDGTGERPWREDDPTRPLSVYGESKLAGERAVQAACGAHLIVRTSWVYAAVGKNFLRTVARLAGEQRELRIVNDQIGAPTPATVIADAVAQILSHDRTAIGLRFAKARGMVHIATEDCTSWHGFATAIIEGLRARAIAIKAERVVPIQTDECPSKARRPRNSRLDLRRLREAFGVRPRDWRSALGSELDQFVRLTRSSTHVHTH